MLESLVKWLNLAADATRDVFLAEHTDAMLVVQPFQEAELGFTTVAAPVVGRQWSGQDPRVVRVLKREGATGFGSSVTVGRASNNDICLEGPGVSKFHAYLRKGPDGFRLYDAGSTHGTFLGEERLQGVAKWGELSSGGVIRLGDVKMTFYEPNEFYDFLRDYLMDPPGSD